MVVDFRSRHLLLGALAPVGSPQPRTPAGVKCLPLQSIGPLTQSNKKSLTFLVRPDLLTVIF
jgi:hypothetical protein